MLIDWTPSTRTKCEGIECKASMHAFIGTIGL